MDLCPETHRSITKMEQSVTMWSIDEIIPSIDLGYQVFLGISSEYSEEHLISSIDRWDNLIDHIVTLWSILVIDRCVFGHKSIDQSIYKKTFEILKPQTLVPQNFLGIFRGNSEEEKGFLGIPSEYSEEIPRK